MLANGREDQSFFFFFPAPAHINLLEDKCHGCAECLLRIVFHQEDKKKPLHTDGGQAIEAISHCGLKMRGILSTWLNINFVYATTRREGLVPTTIPWLLTVVPDVCDELFTTYHMSAN